MQLPLVLFVTLRSFQNQSKSCFHAAIIRTTVHELVPPLHFVVSNALGKVLRDSRHISRYLTRENVNFIYTVAVGIAQASRLTARVQKISEQHCLEARLEMKTIGANHSLQMPIYSNTKKI
jgi:hypothetical protein